MVIGQKKGQLLTHCLKGHEFTESNTIWRTRDRGRGPEIHRMCRICHILRNKKYISSLTKEQKSNRNEYFKQWRNNNKDKIKNSKLKSSFGITLNDYNDLLIKQNNKCFICGKEFKKERNYFAVDHNHNTGKIRGLLCSRCNRSLGWYEKHKSEIEIYLNNNDKIS